MKTITKVLFSLVAMAFVAVGCVEKEGDGSDYGDLAIFFGADNLSVEAGGKISIPFSVLGSEGVVLNLEAVTSDAEVTTKLKYDATYTGTIEFTAPVVVAGQKDVTLTLKVSDKKGRQAENSTTVTMLASEPLALALTDNIKAVATTAGGSFTLPVVLTGKGNATVPETVTISASNGWNASFTWNADKTGGTITVTAPAALTDNVTVTMSFKDNYNREASLEIPLSISTISIAENAANCHIAAPGSTITIKAVKGNSTQELDFNNASLVWQDQMGLVKSVAGNGSAKAIVVELNAGKTGNAVVAAKKDGVIVWSWHVWVTDYDPSEAPMIYTGANGTYTFMDRNLGASTNEKYTAGSFGLFYQWGRKDPFVGADGVESNVYVKKYDMEGNQVREVNELRPIYDDYTTTNLDLSIQNPTVFYYAPSSAWPVVDWLTDDAQLQDNDLWGGVSGHKSIYDPCPEGWMVPPAGDCWGFRKQYRKEGALNDAKPYDPTYAWYIEYEMQYCIGFRYRDTAGKEFWFPFAGKKDGLKGDLNGVAGGTQYHTRNNSNTTVLCEILAWGNPASETGLNRPYGNLIRCIKEN